MNNLLIFKGKTILEALKQLNDSQVKSLIVIEKKNKLFGTLTDGDIRRAILKKRRLSDKILKICNKKPLFFYEKTLIPKLAKKKILEKNLFLAPIINNNKIVVDYVVSKTNLFTKKPIKPIKQKIPIVIMAGGSGTRLEPFTQVLPKPLVPINDKTVIENIIDVFVGYGLDNFLISINFKGKIIKSYFEEIKPKYKVKFLNEKKPLGTAGAIYFAKNKIKNNFIVTNADTIVDLDYNDLISFHKKNKCIITLVIAVKEFEIPYGSCEINREGGLVKIKEKPLFNFLVSTGLYFFNKKIFSIIKKNTKLDMNELIEQAIKKKMKVMVYPVSEKSWQDIGQWNEYQKTIKKLRFD